MKLPASFEPMLPWSAASPPLLDDGWACEVKYDGFRALVFVEAGKVRIQSRNLRDMTPFYPELQGLWREIGVAALLDGELVAYDEEGRQDFEKMRLRAGFLSEFSRRRSQAAQVPISFQVFDLLFFEDGWLLERPYNERRGVLEQLRLKGSHWLTPENFVEGDTRHLLDATRQQGLEGLVCKRLNSPYRPGERHPDWLKVKNWCRQEFVVGGWRTQPGDGQLHSLLVGYFQQQRFCYAGAVELGLTAEVRTALQGVFPQLSCQDCPFAEPPRRAARWLEPRLVVEVQFLGWSSTQRLKHSCFKGFALDKQAQEVVREPI